MFLDAVVGPAAMSHRTLLSLPDVMFWLHPGSFFHRFENFDGGHLSETGPVRL